jgi:hypothetical protein
MDAFITQKPIYQRIKHKKAKIKIKNRLQNQINSNYIGVNIKQKKSQFSLGFKLYQNVISISF